MEILILIVFFCIVCATAHVLPDFSIARKLHQEELLGYVNSFTASAAIGMNAHMFNRITGVVVVYSGEKRYPVSDSDKKVYIGLQLKYFKQVFLKNPVLFDFRMNLLTSNEF